MTPTLLPTRPIDPVKARRIVESDFFRARVQVTDTCAVWVGQRTEKGYGRCGERPERYRAHRLVWVAHHGTDIPAGMTIDHTCGNPACVSVDHLEIVSVNENTRRQHARKASA